MKFQFGQTEIELEFFQLILILSFVIGLCSLRKDTENIVFLIFLTICVICDVVINTYCGQVLGENTISNNVFLIIVSFFYLWFFKEGIFESFSLSKIIIGFTLLYFVYVVVLGNISRIHVRPYMFALVVSTIMIGIYILKLVDRVYFFKEMLLVPKFWLGCGIVFFTATNFPILFHLEAIRYNDNLGKRLFRLIDLGNLILAFSYLFCTICHLRISRYSTK